MQHRVRPQRCRRWRRRHRFRPCSRWLWGLCPVLVGLVPCLASGESPWRVELGATLPYNVPTPLRIRQTGYPDLRLTGRYASRPFDPPVTWQLRVGRWVAQRSWELDLLHHKLFLDNRPPEVESFGVSHGFNLVTLFRGWSSRHAELRAGVGVALVHAENVVRGARLAEDRGFLGSGYYFGGPTASIAAGRPMPLAAGFLVDVEARLAITYAAVPIADGHADVFAVLLQFAVLAGWSGSSPGGSR